jgi:hypothetical protein
VLCSVAAFQIKEKDFSMMMVNYLGTSANNVVTTNSTGADVIEGLDGNDTLTLNNANNDTFYAPYGSQLNGGNGNDTLILNKSKGVFIGSRWDSSFGNDTIKVTDSSNVAVYDPFGNNTVVLTTVQNSFVNLGDGADTVKILGDSLNYVPPRDTLENGSINRINYIDTGAGNDNISVTTQSNNIYAGEGNDKIALTFKPTSALPTLGSTIVVGANSVDGGDGNDVITSNLPVGYIAGGDGNDTITINNNLPTYSQYTFQANSELNELRSYNIAVDGGFGKDTITLSKVTNAVVADGSVVNITAKGLPSDGFYNSPYLDSETDGQQDTIKLTGSNNLVTLTDGDILVQSGTNNDVRLYLGEDAFKGSLTSTNVSNGDVNYKGGNDLFLVGNNPSYTEANAYKNYVFLRQGNDLLIGVKDTNLYDTVIKNEFVRNSGFQTINATVDEVANHQLTADHFDATLGVTDLINLTNQLHFTSLDAVRASATALDLIHQAWHIA